MQTRQRFPTAFFVLLLVISTGAIAQEQTAVPPRTSSKPATATIEDFAWIAGNWQGEAMGGTFEETWNAPSSGAMVGMFKFANGDKINFYEILTIVPKDDSLVLRLKHFDTELVGWEEKDKSIEFPFVSVSETVAKFEGLTFTRIGPDRMDIKVMVKNEGQTNELIFACHRSPTKSKSNATNNREINRILDVDQVLAKQRDALPAGQSLAVAVEAYVLGLDQLDFSKCPAEFAIAFNKHRDAWNGSKSFFAKHSELRGQMHEAIKQIRLMDQAVVAELDSHLATIMDTWGDVEQAAKKFGVN